MNIALILSGGTGSRVGTDLPKQYIEVGGRPIVDYCLETILLHNQIDAVQMVADAQWHDLLLTLVQKRNCNQKFKGFSMPGENRQLSVFHGLQDIRKYADETDVVFIHDAARPQLDDDMITRCLDAMEGHDGVLPVIPMKDTIYGSSDGKKVDALLKRNEIFAGQAPEAFCFGKYYEANQQLMPERIFSINGSTEPAIMADMDIVMIAGDENNFKITTKLDLSRFEQIINGRENT